MAKSARASGIKKNKAVLKRRVFGPVETARNERLSAKLLQLAQQPKPKQPTTNNSEIDLETEGMLLLDPFLLEEVFSTSFRKLQGLSQLT